MSSDRRDPFIRVRGARENSLRAVDVDVPRDGLVVFTGVSGSGKSSLACVDTLASCEASTPRATSTRGLKSASAVAVRNTA